MQRETVKIMEEKSTCKLWLLVCFTNNFKFPVLKIQNHKIKAPNDLKISGADYFR